MRKTAIAITLLAWCAAFAFAQAGDQRVLAILPFTGGVGGDGEAIAALLEAEPAISDVFTVVPRGRTLEVVFAEHRFQMDQEFTAADTIAGIGNILNANYVLSGSIRRLGDRNLVIATLLHVERLEQVAGYWLTYRAGIEEVRYSMPNMSRSMADAARRDTSRLPNLAILPLDIAGVSPHDVETLAQILAIEMIRAGSYAILPRTSAIESAVAEMGFQELGYTLDQGMAEVGRAINAQYALSIRAHRFGPQNFFTAAMLSVRHGTLRGPAAQWDFRVIEDGIDGMRELALRLDSAGALVVRGDDHFDRSEYNQAIAAFEEALSHSPNHPRAGQRLEAAITRWDIVGEVVNTANAHVTRGNDYLNGRRFHQAVAEFEAALRLMPNHPSAYRYLQNARNAEREREAMVRTRFHSIGLSVGTSLAEPWAVGTVQITFSPWRFGFFRLGCDFGILSDVSHADYHSIYPFIQYGLFVPFGGWGGWHLGVGGGLIMERFGIEAFDIEVRRNIPAADITTGLVMWNRIDISYTLRVDISDFPDFSNLVLTQKISVGVIHRFARPSRRR